jgi:hypothetical protein
MREIRTSGLMSGERKRTVYLHLRHLSAIRHLRYLSAFAMAWTVRLLCTMMREGPVLTGHHFRRWNFLTVLCSRSLRLPLLSGISGER